VKLARPMLVIALVGVGIPVVLPAGAARSPVARAASPTATANSDFNGDGYADLAIGAPYEDLSDNAVDDAGTVHVLYGSPTAPNLLSAEDDQAWTQDSSGVQGTAEKGDKFGSALASGDFDGDGYDDLAIGIPGEDLESTSDVDAGSVAILYGSSSGLTATGDEVWTQDSVGIDDQAEDHDKFGSALAAGDINVPFDFCIEGDFDDLAIGVPNEGLGGGAKPEAGAVHILFSSPSGLDDCGDQFWTQDTQHMPNEAEAGDHFGASLATGQFDIFGVGVAIGVPDEDIGGIADAGGVAMLDAWFGLNAGEFWHQDSGGVTDQAEAEDHFGYALASADFFQVVCCGEDLEDLAIGVHGENGDAGTDTGTVLILSGDETDHGLQEFGHRYLTQGVEQAGAKFGYSLAAGPPIEESSDRYLAIGVPYYDVAGISNAGLVVLEYYGGGTDGEWTQDSTNVLDDAEAEDRFGASLAGAVTSGTYTLMLSIGVPREDVESISNAGAVAVLYGGTSGFAATDNQFWSQNSPSVANTAESGDRMGESVT
jgi:hypothetical protein